jgi:O-antigen/teichoic acid export membrane protein
VNKINRIGKESTWIVFGQAMTIFSTIILIRVLTAYLDPAEYGKLALTLTVGGLINQVITGGLTNGIIRHYSIANEEKDLNGYFSASIKLIIYHSLGILILATLIVIGLVLLGYSNLILLAIGAVVLSTLSAIKGILNGIQNSARHRAFVAIHDSLEAWLKLGIALGVIQLLDNSISAVIVSYMLATSLVILSQLVFFSSTIKYEIHYSKQNSAWKRKIWIYSLPFMTWGIFGWAQQSSASWTLSMLTTTEEVGFYSILMQLGYAPIQLFTGLVLTFITPILFTRAGDSTSETRNNSANQLIYYTALLGLGLTVLATIVAEILHAEIFSLFVDERYHSVSKFFPWMILSGGIFSIAQLYATRMMVFMDPKKLIAASIGSSLFGIIITYLSVNFFGLRGAIMALLAHAVIYLLWTVSLRKRPDGVA